MGWRLVQGTRSIIVAPQGGGFTRREGAPAITGGAFGRSLSLAARWTDGPVQGTRSITVAAQGGGASFLAGLSAGTIEGFPRLRSFFRNTRAVMRRRSIG